MQIEQREKGIGGTYIASVIRMSSFSQALCNIVRGTYIASVIPPLKKGVRGI